MCLDIYHSRVKQTSGEGTVKEVRKEILGTSDASGSVQGSRRPATRVLDHPKRLAGRGCTAEPVKPHGTLLPIILPKRV